MHISLAKALLVALSLGRPAHAESGNVRNANHIFNAVHSSMRQWGSSLYHNGMSFFIARVPAGTQLYHGRSNNATVTGIEWVSFEPEHALMFAIPRPRSGDPPRPPPGKPPGRGHGQFVLSPDEGHDDEDERNPAWLHTYTTKRDLQFLYVDGTSAGKTDKGTLDSQDYVLLGREDHTDPFWDGERAKRLCALIQDEWGSELSGIVRMEAGFEIIMCSFADSLDMVYATAVAQRPEIFPPDFAYMRMLASRYHGIGEGRVSLDYERMVTAYRDLDMPDRNEQHRLNETSDGTLERLRAEVRDMALDTTTDRFGGTDWQAVADMIVLRWADWLRFLLTLGVSGLQEQFDHQLVEVLRPFVNDLAPNATVEAYQCSRQHLTKAIAESQSTSGVRHPSLAQQAVTSIAERICSTLVEAYHAKDSTLRERVGLVQDLVDYLRWTAFKECRGCDFGEVCVVAAWPFGDKEDHFTPSCKNESRRPGSSYWRDQRWGLSNLDSLSMHGRMSV